MKGLEEAMKRAAICLILFVLCQVSIMAASEIINGSFEDNRRYVSDLTKPNAVIGWDSASYVGAAMDGWIEEDWYTDGDYSLTLISHGYNVCYEGDFASIAQNVNLADVDYISFDVELTTYGYGIWDSNLRTMQIKIDGEVVWNSDSLTNLVTDANDIQGEFISQLIDIRQECDSGLLGDCPQEVPYDDVGTHRLEISLICDQNDPDSEIYYFASIDNIVFNNHCGGLGFPAGDFNRDCTVSLDELATLCDIWLTNGEIYDKHNLSGLDDFIGYGFLNLRDYAAAAQNWDGNYSLFSQMADSWLNEVELSNELNYYNGDDVESYSEINMYDLAELANGWMQPEMPLE